MISLVVPGDPVAKARARTTRNKGTYTPARTREATERVAWAARAAMAGRPPTTEPVVVSLRFYCKTRRRPDVDNLTKLVFDACNRIIFADDCQVAELHCWRTLADPNPRTEILVCTPDEVLPWA